MVLASELNPKGSNCKIAFDEFSSKKLTPKLLSCNNCLPLKLEEPLNHTLVFNFEETLLKSSSWFHFFMLVAFEGGSLLRAFILLVLHPLICFLDDELRLKIMVFVCFVGVKKSSFRIGRTVLPKFFLEDVGLQGYEMVMRFRNKVGVSNFPRVMVEGFLKDFLEIESVFGREIRVYGGYYLGLMESKRGVTREDLKRVIREEDVSVMCGFEKTIKDQQLFTKCKELYIVREAEKEKWNYLPRDKYPKPLIFHDGRLAFLPTPMASLAMFIWLPFGIILLIARIAVSCLFPYKISIPILAFLGTSGVLSQHYYSHNQKSNGSTLYVCNHKTLFDPIYISFACGDSSITALTYSISKISEILSPIKIVSLTRDKEKDAKLMRKMMSKGSIVLCPEGTTCREPYLLRFSPLFAEMTDDIVPVALEARVSMFYGTTASGIKALDPVFFLLNPNSYYYVNFLEKLPKSHTCVSGGMSKIEVANYVQAQIAKALGFKTTGLTRKNKYMFLAGNTGS